MKERRNEWINTQMNELTIALVNEQMNGQTNERTNEWTNEWTNELSNRCSDKRIVWLTDERTVGQMLGRKNSLMDGRTNHRMFKWMNEQLNEQLMIKRTITWIIVLYILGNKCGTCLYTTWPVTTSLRHVFQHWLSHYVP